MVDKDETKNIPMQNVQNLISRKAARPWQLDAKRAKTIARVASNGEVLLSRKKRGWWWGESKEEKEEDREDLMLGLFTSTYCVPMFLLSDE